MKLLALALFAGALVAQTPAAPAKPDGLPDYTIAAGYGVSPSSSVAGFAGNQEAWVQGGVKVMPKLFATSTIDFTRAANVMRAGGAYQIAPGLLFRVDGGLAFGAVAIGSFSGGLIYSHPLSSKSNLNLTTELRVTTNPAGPAGAVNVGIYIGIQKGFFKN